MSRSTDDPHELLQALGPTGLLDDAPVLFLVLDADGRVAFVNRTAATYLGAPGPQLVGRLIGELTTPEHAAFVAAALRGEEDAHGAVRDERRVIDGAERAFTWEGRVLRGDDDRIAGLVATGVDVTEGRAAEAEVAHLAYHDGLTGLPNRALLLEHLGVALGRARRHGTAVAVLSLDLRDFKLVNESLGHEAGDRLIEEVAARLSARRRGADVLARTGGDEFLLLIADLEPATAAAHAQAAAEAVLAALRTPFAVAGAEFHVGGNVGVSLHPDDAQDAASLLRHAHAAMYEAKALGPDEVRAYTGTAEEPLRRLSMTRRLRAAIREEELVLHWQPIVEPASRRLASLEALVRWQDPSRGLLAPGDFIPFAEENGLIRRLGDHVLELICRQRRRWADAGLVADVTMNVSPRQLEPGFPGRLADRHVAYGLDPYRLTIEITESAAMQDAGRVEPVLAEIAATGARIAIDDFGAGYSSLSRLRRLPVSMLKIDRQFLVDAPHEATGRTIVTAVVELSKALGMEAVAEGVEVEEQRAFLVGLKCPLAQGFLLGRPLVVEDATALLAEERRHAARA